MSPDRPALQPPVPPPVPVFDPVLVFERNGQPYCCPAADVVEIAEEPALDDPGYAAPLVAAVLSHGGRFIPAIDPAGVFDRPAARRGDAILIQGPLGVVALLADRVVGFRKPDSVAPAPWIPPGRLCRSAATIDGIGRAFLFGADGIGDVPAAAPVAAQVPVPAQSPAGAVATPADAGAMHLVFTIGGRLHAAAYGEVRRILHRQRSFRIPGGTAPVRHAVEVTGAVVPVLDLTGALDRADAAGSTGDRRCDFVVLSCAAGPLALRVDRIERPLALVRDATEPGWFPSPGIAGIARRDDRDYALVTGASLWRDLLDGTAAEAPAR